LNELQQKSLTSIEVADMVEKSHNELLKDVRRYIDQLGEGKIAHSDFFAEST
jgi:phage regulator Rha-like protein